MKPSRILLVTILATGALYVASFVALGSSFPTIDSSEHEIVKWFSENGTRARIYAWTAAFVSLGLAIFGGQVAALLPKPHRYIFFAGVLGCAITPQVQAWFWAGLALHPQSLDPAAARKKGVRSHRQHWHQSGKSLPSCASLSGRPTSGSARPPVAAPSLRFRRGNGRRASLDVSFED
jgi:hypothetical protein